jgi:hypothetical protein
MKNHQIVFNFSKLQFSDGKLNTHSRIFEKVIMSNMNMEKNNIEETINIQGEPIYENESPQVTVKEIAEFSMTEDEQKFLDLNLEGAVGGPRVSHERKIERSDQFGDLKTTNYLTKMNSNLMQNIVEMFNVEILKFAKRVNAEYPEVPVDGMLTIWCKQQNMPLSTFDIEKDVYDIATDVDEEPEVPKKKASPKKAPAKPKKKAVAKKDDADVEDDADVDSLAQSVNGVALSDAEDDARSSCDEEPEIGKKKKKSPPKKEGKVCLHRYIKGKNANSQCTTMVKGEGEFCSKHKKSAGN